MIKDIISSKERVSFANPEFQKPVDYFKTAIDHLWCAKVNLKTSPHTAKIQIERAIELLTSRTH